MLLSTLKHYLYDIALNAMFDKITENFLFNITLKKCTIQDIKKDDYILVTTNSIFNTWVEGYVLDISNYTAYRYTTYKIKMHKVKGNTITANGEVIMIGYVDNDSYGLYKLK